MSRGLLMFANDSPQLDYGTIALCNALMIKANMREPVALVTDVQTHASMLERHGSLVERAFDHVLLRDQGAAQSRTIRDSAETNQTISWRNNARQSAFELSPFDETVLLDADYLVLGDSLNLVWGSHQDFRINSRALTLEHKEPQPDEVRLEPFGIPMYWATCVYFKKNEGGKKLFDTVGHVRDNYAFYRFLYKFPGTLFRNDYAFSIAVHLLAGMVETSQYELPTPEIFSSFDSDELIDVPAKNEFLFLVNDSSDRSRYRVNKVCGLNVHVMNKFSLLRQAEKILSLYGGDHA